MIIKTKTIDIPIQKFDDTSCKTTMLQGLLFGAHMPSIKKVIFNDPATIIYWSDDTKTVVKVANGETFNKEVGLSQAIAKKYFECIGFPNPRGAFKKVVINAHDMTRRTQEKKLLKAAKAE